MTWTEWANQITAWITRLWRDDTSLAARVTTLEQWKGESMALQDDLQAQFDSMKDDVTRLKTDYLAVKQQLADLVASTADVAALRAGVQGVIDGMKAVQADVDAADPVPTPAPTPSA